MKKRWFIIGGAVVVVAIMTAIAVVLLSTPRVANADVTFVSVQPTEGVEIRLGDQPLGDTPFQTALPPGEYRYLASLPGYRPYTGRFAVVEGQPVEVEIPPLDPLGGAILVQCNAPAQLYVNGEAKGTCSTDTYGNLGHYDRGSYTVRAEMPLEIQEQTAVVYDTVDAQLAFQWNAQLVVTVEPATATVQIFVDGKPAKMPYTITAKAIAAKAFVQVQVQAEGYLPWANDVFVQPGEKLTVQAVLEPGPPPTPLPEDPATAVLAAYWHYWEIYLQSYADLDPAPLAEVLTGELLQVEQDNIAGLVAWGATADVLTYTAHVPTIEMLSAVTASVQVAYEQSETMTFADGQENKMTSAWEGAFTFVQGVDGVWRAASWTTAAGPAPTTAPVPTPGGGGPAPTPAPTSGGGSGGDGQGQAADRGLVAQIIVASANCVRQAAGFAPLTWDQEIADALAPVAEAETRFYQAHGYYDASFDAQEKAALQPLGAYMQSGGGICLSYSPGNAKWGLFACDWENYVDNPCATGYADNWAGRPETASFTRIGIAIGAPYWDGAGWVATILIAAR